MHIRSILSAGAVAATVLGTLTVAAPAGAADMAPGAYRLVNVATRGACLTSSTERGATPRLGVCDDAIWNVTPAYDGNGYAIERDHSGNCLGMSPLRIYPPRVWTDDCYGPWAHSWNIADTGRGTVQLSPTTYQNGCLSVPDQGAPAIIEPCGSNPTQDWRLIPLD